MTWCYFQNTFNMIFEKISYFRGIFVSCLKSTIKVLDLRSSLVKPKWAQWTRISVEYPGRSFEKQQQSISLDTSTTTGSTSLKEKKRKKKWSLFCLNLTRIFHTAPTHSPLKPETIYLPKKIKKRAFPFVLWIISQTPKYSEENSRKSLRWSFLGTVVIECKP